MSELQYNWEGNFFWWHTTPCAPLQNIGDLEIAYQKLWNVTVNWHDPNDYPYSLRHIQYCHRQPGRHWKTFLVSSMLWPVHTERNRHINVNINVMLMGGTFDHRVFTVTVAESLGVNRPQHCNTFAYCNMQAHMNGMSCKYNYAVFIKGMDAFLCMQIFLFLLQAFYKVKALEPKYRNIWPEPIKNAIISSCEPITA